MRTRAFIDIFNRVIRRLGRDPLGDIDQNLARDVIDSINERVRTICQSWRWPEWELTEERAYRQVWHADAQYLRVSEGGKPDEVFFIPNTTYYRVNPDVGADPPVGVTPDTVSPGGPTYWIQIDFVDPYIAYDQRCKRSIGMALGVYSQNPTSNGTGGYRFSPSERGISIDHASGPTAFITYKMPVPQYTIVPYVLGRNYQKGQVTFDPTIGEVFQALAPTTALPADSNYWRRVPFLAQWENYVVYGVNADMLTEYDQAGGADAQVRLAMAASAEDKALQSLQVEVDSLTTQGQLLQWKLCSATAGWCETQPWSGGTVSELTDSCDDELGWVYPTPTPTPQVVWQYRPEVTALLGAPHTLQGLPTRTWLPGSLVEIVITVSGTRQRQTWNLLAGPADLTDPGQVRPADYDSATNNKHWEKVT